MGPTKPNLRLDAVATGDRHLAHVHAAEARYFERSRFGHGDRRAPPTRELLDDIRVLPVAYHDLAVDPQPCADEPILPVAVGGLVEVHEVHVELSPGQLAVKLGVKMREGLL